jgi:phosphatidylglycerophosphatase A
MRTTEKVVLFISTGAYTGHLPYAPGTFGSLLGIPLCYLLSRRDPLWAILCTVALISLAIWIADLSEKILKQKDPGCIVIDEIGGQVVALLGLPFGVFIVPMGFIVFRIFDVLKPFPIRFVERHLPGGAGVVMDDIVAGVFTNAILRGYLLLKATLDA